MSTTSFLIPSALKYSLYKGHSVYIWFVSVLNYPSCVSVFYLYRDYKLFENRGYSSVVLFPSLCSALRKLKMMMSK